MSHGQLDIPSDEEILHATAILVKACHYTMWNIGWYHDPTTGELLNRNRGEMFAMIHSEISEALEGHRKDLMDDKLPHRKMTPVELCDAAIRVFDMLGAYYADQFPALLEKLKYNETRPDHKHENRVKANGKKY